MIYNGLSKKEVFDIYFFALNQRKLGFGQRSIHKLIRIIFKKEISENTIASWVYYWKIPFESEKTQFKPLPKPAKKELYQLYVKQKQSAESLAKGYGVSTSIVINWLRDYEIQTRTHLESMNTPIVKEGLREKRLKKPTKKFSAMSPEKAYILGVLCGDGYIRPGTIQLEIRYDEEFIRRFTECLNIVYGLDFLYKYCEKRNSFKAYITSEIISKDLLRYGKFGTFEWRVPKGILNGNDKKVISNFLRGMYDSEGTVSKSSIALSSVNKKGLGDISKLLKILGIKSSIYMYRNKYYNLYIFRKERFKIYKEKVGFTIKRKENRLNEVLKNGISYKPA